MGFESTPDFDGAIPCGLGAMNMNGFWLLGLLVFIATGACVDVCPPPAADGGPLDFDVHAACGDSAGIFEGDEDQIAITGNCVVRSGAQISEINLSGITEVIGTLTVQMGPNEVPVQMFTAIESAINISVGPSVSLQTVRFSALQRVHADLSVRSNASLRTLEAPLLSLVGEHLSVVDNPFFPTCDAEELVSQLSSPPESVEIEGGCDACCP